MRKLAMRVGVLLIAVMMLPIEALAQTQLVIPQITVGSTLRRWTGFSVGSQFAPSVAIVDASGNQITSFGGSGGTASTFGALFPATGTAIGCSDGTNMVACGTASNPFRIDPTGTTPQPVTGTFWQATQPVSGTVTANQGGTWTVTGAGGTFPVTGTFWQATQPISAASLPLPALAATSTKQSDGSQKTQIVDGSGNVIAATSNNLNVQCANCSGSGVSTADAATFTASTSLFAGAGGFFQTTATSNALTNGQQGMFQVTANRALFSNLRNAAGTEVGTAATPLQVTGANGTFPVTGTFWQATQPVSAASGSYASGAFASGAIASGAMVDLGAIADAAATAGSTGSVSAKLRLMTTQLATLNTTLGTPMQATGGTVAATQSGTWNITNISGTVSLPTGAATAANQVADQAPVAAATATATKSLLIGTQFDTTQKTLTNGQQAALSGTARGALIVAPGVESFAVQATLAAETTKVIGTVNQGTSPWVVSGNLTNISGTISLPTGAATAAKQPALGTAGTSSADVITVQGRASMTPLDVNVLTAVGLADGSTSSGQTWSKVGCNVTTAAPTYTTAQSNPCSMTTAGDIRAVFSNTTIAVTNAGTFAVQATLAAETTKVIGTVNQGTSPWVVSGNLTNISGTISLPTGAATAANQVADQAPVAAATATATKSILIGTQFDTTQKTLTNGQQAALSGTARGALIVAPGIENFAVQATLAAETTKVIGTVNQGTSPWVVSGNLTNISGTISLPTGAATAANQTTWQSATGAAPPANAVNLGANSSGAAGGLLAGIIQCDSTAFYDASTSGSTELVALTSGRAIYICGYEFKVGGNVGVKFVYGTGTNCGTSEVSITPNWLNPNASEGLATGSPFYRGLKTAVANALCLKTSAGVAVQAQVYYAKL